MLVRERLAISVAILAAAVLLVLPGCSTNNPRDVNVTYAAEAGQLSYFGPIDVQGNSSVSDRRP